MPPVPMVAPLSAVAIGSRFNRFDDLIVVFWLILLVYWLISARGVKSNRQGVSWLREAGVRVALAVAVILLMNSPLRRSISAPHNPAIASIGSAFCGLGIALAIWARVYLGRNWGMPATLKVEPELVTTGPYAFVRHPIYAGIILAMVGTVLVIGMVWLVVLAIFCVYFLFNATREEKLLTKAFPRQYPDYQQRTKMLIPFIF